MGNYLPIAADYLAGKNIECERRSEYRLALPFGYKTTDMTALFGDRDSEAPEDVSGWGRIEYWPALRFRRENFMDGLLACNKLNAAGGWVQWNVTGAKNTVYMAVHADLHRATAGEGFFRQVRGMQLGLLLGIPELEAARQGLRGSTAAQYAAAFRNTLEKLEGPEQGDAAAYADALEKYVRQTGYLASREDERTVKVRLGSGVYGTAAFRGNGDMRLESCVYHLRNDMLAKGLIACSEFNSRWWRLIFYMNGSAEIYMRRDMFVQPETACEDCIRQLEDMAEKRAEAIQELREILYAAENG